MTDRAHQARKVFVAILTADEKHCSSDCPHMESMPYCRIFGKLLWDKRRKLNGYLRHANCMKDEIEPESTDEDSTERW